jgi:cobalamin transport system ATP-binding protein
LPVAGSEALVLENVTAGYAARTVLRGVSLSVHAGEVVGLIGPNGSGKTTAVRVSSRTLPPRTGRVLVAGHDPYTLPARRAARLLSVVPQELAPTFEFTALEVVLMGRSSHLTPLGGGGPDDYRAARSAMESAGIIHLGDRPVGELSGGEKQRVILAQALAQEAPVMLLDEPTTHLDPGHVVGILETVHSLARGGTAVMAVFHDLNLASASCDRLVALSGGQVVEDGPPEQVVTSTFLREVYGVEAEVHPHFATGRPVVLLGPRLRAPTRTGSMRAHVVGGGGRGAPLIRGLAELGFDVSVGVVHSTDTDEVVAERLNLVRVTVPPFSHIGDEAAMEALGLMRSADVTVVADAPYGPGNMANLTVVLAAVRDGHRVVLMDQVPMRDRDFTGGAASRLWGEISRNAEIAGSYEEVLASVAGAPLP